MYWGLKRRKKQEIFPPFPNGDRVTQESTTRRGSDTAVCCVGHLQVSVETLSQQRMCYYSPRWPKQPAFYETKVAPESQTTSELTLAPSWPCPPSACAVKQTVMTLVSIRD
ncbi:hypothetical protein T265_15475, partial [Opisthorchis viverrini]